MSSIKEIRIVLLGNTGSGKSATGNSILMKEEEQFEENDDPVVGTANCVTRSANPPNKQYSLSVTDTPGLNSTDKSKEEQCKHIIQFMGQISPGPHCIAIVVSAKSRVSTEIRDTIQTFAKMFGEKSRKHMVFIFTNIDLIRKKRGAPPTPIEEFVKSLKENDPILKELLDQCQDRYVGFNNSLIYGSEDQKVQLERFLEKVDEMLKETDYACYTSEDFENVEKLMKKLDLNTGSRSESRNVLGTGVLGMSAARKAAVVTGVGISTLLGATAAGTAGALTGATVAAGISLVSWKIYKSYYGDNILKEAIDRAENLSSREHGEPNDTTEDNLRLVIIGETGTGKSETANSILMDPEAFHSEVAAASVTSICKIESREVFGIKISIVDTPGLFDTGQSDEQMIKEIIRCIFMSSPGPHAILLTLRIRRLTEQVQKTVTLFKEHFGKESTKFMIVIFTFKDDLAARRGKPEKSIQEYVAGITENDVRKVLRECNGRYLAFNNHVETDSTDNEEQVKELLALIQKTKRENQNSFYTNKMLEEAEKIMKERENEVRKELEEEKKAKEEEIKKKYEGELKEELLADIKREFDAHDPRYTARKQMEDRTRMDAIKGIIQDLFRKNNSCVIV